MQRLVNYASSGSSDEEDLQSNLFHITNQDVQSKKGPLISFKDLCLRTGFCLNVRGIFNFPGRLSDESAAAEFLIRLNRKIDEDFVGNDALFECLHSNIIAPDQYTVPIMRMHLSNYVELFKETLKVDLSRNLSYRNMTVENYIERMRKGTICGMDITLLVFSRMWGVTFGVITDHEIWLSNDVDHPEQVDILLGTQRALTFYNIVGSVPVDLRNLAILKQSPNSHQELRFRRLGLRKKSSTVSIAPPSAETPTDDDLAILAFEQAMTSTPRSSPDHPLPVSPKSNPGNLVPEDNYNPATALMPINTDSDSSNTIDGEMLHRSNLFDSSNDEIANILQSTQSGGENSPVFGRPRKMSNTSAKDTTHDQDSQATLPYDPTDVKYAANDSAPQDLIPTQIVDSTGTQLGPIILMQKLDANSVLEMDMLPPYTQNIPQSNDQNLSNVAADDSSVSHINTNADSDSDDIVFLGVNPASSPLKTNVKTEVSTASSSEENDQTLDAMVCSYCKILCTSKATLDLHRSICAAEHRFPCPHPDCDKRFKMRHIVKRHFDTVHGDARVKCDTDGCPKDYKSIYTRREHIKRCHDKEKKYFCSTCGKGFLHRSEYHIHLRKERGVKPFLCNYCRKHAFFSRVALEQHSRDCGNENYYQCDKCGQTFNRSRYLRSHIASVHKNDQRHKCTLCPKDYKHRGGLAKHMKEKHGQKL